MKRFWTYIFIALFVGLLTTSCIEELDMPQSVTTDDTETILVPRVTSFANQYVTKSAYGTKETTITSLAVLVFNSDGNLVFLQENSNLDGASPVTLNKSRLNLASATVVMFANMSIDNIKNSDNKSIRDNKSTLTLTGMEGYTYHIPENQTFITDITSNFAGFPMVGGVKGVNLTPTTTQQSQIEVSLKILFAKISLEIAVENGTENTLNPTQFTISSATITNLATATPLAIPAEAGEKPKDFLGNEKNEGPLESADYTDETFVDTSSEHKTKTITSTSKTVSAGSTSTNAKYTFYIAENRYNHGDTKGVYPSDSWLTSNLYDNYKQQYKPKLAEKTDGEGLPTYITLTGVYKDYRSTEWNVTYKVYLGKNNYDNFQIDRNSEYKNYLTIKGIRNNDTYTDAGSVWIDHRVNVSYTGNGADDCVTITRETLIDSHIEVRPLRINLTESDYVTAAIYLPTYPLDKDGRIIYDAETQPTSWGQIAEIAGGSNENWIAIENNNGSISRGKLYCASGKRKYFTTSLIEELHLQNDSEDHGIKVDQQGNRYLALSNNDCVWIYFDENLFSRRRARISIVFYKENGASVTETYDIFQAGLKSAGGYLIEEYEEYLHSYDSDMSTTPMDYTQQGLSWGMLQFDEDGDVVGKKLSDSHIVKSVREGYELLSERYDYYHANDGSYYIFKKNADASWSEVDKSQNTGLIFTARASIKDNMSIIDMGTEPTSAYQYCLSKNKFHESLGDGNHSMMIHWYLPDVYEMSSILNAAKTDESLKDFAQDAYYWSSQPSYSTSLLQVVDETDDHARAVSTSGEQTLDIHRSEQHRIRCVRSPQGEYANMAERVPDGLGGLIKIPMTVKDNGFFNNTDWITLLGEEPTDDYDNDPYRYPMGDTYQPNDPYREIADNYFDGVVFDGVHYYKKNPLSNSNWGGINAGDYTTYDAMHPENWPGLTPNKTEEVLLDRYRILNNTPRTDKKTAIVRVGSKISSMPNVSSVALDHNEGSENLTISFGPGTNNSHEPTYEYYNETSASIEEWTKYWQVPTYTHIPSEPVGSKSCSKARPTYNENNIKNEIQEEYMDGSALKKKVIQGNPTFNYNETEYIYTSEREARAAAENFFNSEINKSGKYKITSIETPNTSVPICTYSYKGQTYKLFSGWKDNGEKGTNVTYSETRYTWSLSYSTLDLYHYKPNTGGWDQGTKTQDGPTTPARSNVDKLTIYGGNTFTISAANGYRIRSIKVNYKESNHIGTLLGIGRYLRLVDANVDLPPRNQQPSNMTYSVDGDQGWFKWTSSSQSGGDQSVTLKLATYSVSTSVNIFGATIPSSYEYVNPSNAVGYSSDFDSSIVIDSFEIRIEEVEESTHAE